MKKQLLLILFAASSLLVLSQNPILTVSNVNNVFGSSANLPVGSSFILDLQFSTPPGCDKVIITIDIPTDVVFLSPIPGSGLYTGTQSGTTLTVMSTGPISSSEKIQVNLKIKDDGTVCENQIYSFTATVAFQNGTAPCSSAVFSNTVTVKGLYTQQHSIVVNRENANVNLCAGGYAKYKILLPHIDRYGGYNLTNVVINAITQGTPVTLLDGSYNNVAFTYTPVSGNTCENNITWNITNINVNVSKTYYLIVSYPCNCFQANSVVNFQANLTGLRPCAVSEIATSNLLTNNLSSVCCSGSNSTGIVAKTSYYGYDLCPGGCNPGNYSILFDNTFNNQNYNNLTISDLIPPEITVTGINSDTYLTYLDNALNDLQFCYKTNQNPTWVCKTVKNSPISGELFRNFSVTSTGGAGNVSNLDLLVNERIIEIKWEFNNPILAWIGLIQNKIIFTVNSGVTSVTDNIANFTSTSPFLNTSALTKVFLTTCNPYISQRKTVKKVNDNNFYSSIGNCNPGDILRYRLVTSNLGSGDLNNAILADILPIQFDYIGNPLFYFGPNSSAAPSSSIVLPAGATYNFDLNTGTVNMSNISIPSKCLNNAQYLIVEFDVKIKPGTAVGSYKNNYTINALTSGYATVNVNNFYKIDAKLYVDCAENSEKTDTTIKVKAGDDVYYRYVITNQGNISISDIRIGNLIPGVGDKTLSVCGNRNSQYQVDYGFPGAVTNLSGPPSITGFSNSGNCLDNICSPPLTGNQTVSSNELVIALPSAYMLAPNTSIIYRVKAKASTSATIGQKAFNDYTFCAKRDDTGNQIQPATSNMASVAIQVSSDCAVDTINCKNLIKKFDLIDIDGKSCCYRLTITNPYPNTLEHIVLHTTGGNSLSYTNLLNGWTIFQMSSTQIEIQAPTTYLPTGTTSVLEYCIDYTSSPQIINGYFTSKDKKLCPFINNSKCQPPTIDSCLSIVEDRLECKENRYYYSFCVKNASNNSFSIKEFTMVATGSATINTQSVPLGVTTTVSGLVHSFVLPVALAPGSVSCTYIVELLGVVPGQSVEFPITGHKDATHTVCCFDSDNVKKIIIKDLCAPDCVKQMDVEAVNLIDPLGDKVPCCYTLRINNDYQPNYFTNIVVNAISSGVSFSSYSANPPWTGTIVPGLTSMTFSYNPTIPSNLSIVANYCISGGGANKSIEVLWYKGEKIVCRDTIDLECNSSPMNCADIVRPVLNCDPKGNYQLQFTVKNLSGFAANKITLICNNPVLSKEFNISLANNATSPLLSVDLTGLGMISGNAYCFTVVLHRTNQYGQDVQCCEGETECFVAPQCTSASCECNSEDFIYFKGPEDFIKKIKCGDKRAIPCNTKYMLFGDYVCKGECAISKYNIKITGPNNFLETYSSPNLNITLYFERPGDYEINVDVNCGDKKCRCTLKFNVNCEKCDQPILSSKDAILVQMNENENFGNRKEILVGNLPSTKLGKAGLVRSLIEFDLSQIPKNEKITAAWLSLTGWKTDEDLGGSRNILGTNSLKIQRIDTTRTSKWLDTKVTWANQPNVAMGKTSKELVQIADIQKYQDVSVDVTALVNEMHKTSNNGMLLSLQNENDSKNGVFANFYSRDNMQQTFNIFPTLQICYGDKTIGVAEKNNENLESFSIYPNPANNVLTIAAETPAESELNIKVYDLRGRMILSNKIEKGVQFKNVDITNLIPGMYIVEISYLNQILKVQKVIKQL